jgi:sulfur-oxidizing protein SoxA
MKPGPHRRVGGWTRWRSCGAALALALHFGPAPAAAAEADPRRTGLEFMSPALQALQRDDTQNPAQLWVQEGAALWTRPAADGKACSTCHADGSQRAMAARHPRIDERSGRPVTLAGRIDQCRQRHQGLPPQDADGPELLALAAYLAMASRGLPLAPDDDPRLGPWAERGQRLWQQRMGQLNLSCANCHDQNAGRRLGGAAIPQAHPTGYPSYRLEWQTLGSLPRRLRSCLNGVRAEPFAPGADEWLALEVYLARRAAGMTLEGPSVRP